MYIICIYIYVCVYYCAYIYIQILYYDLHIYIIHNIHNIYNIYMTYIHSYTQYMDGPPD